jgi:hypothetical protein
MRKLFVEFTAIVRVPVEIDDNDDISDLIFEARSEAFDTLDHALETYNIDPFDVDEHFVVYDENMSVVEDDSN